MHKLRLEIRKIVEKELENEKIPILRRTFSRAEVDENIKNFYAQGLSIDDLFNNVPQNDLGLSTGFNNRD